MDRVIGLRVVESRPIGRAREFAVLYGLWRNAAKNSPARTGRCVHRLAKKPDFRRIADESGEITTIVQFVPYRNAGIVPDARMVI
ncbi:MAG TPA: hypothetical protein PL143_01840 [Rhodocyclaceae bacterium]|nr:hypothetical protein [Rhodocyclaceae bacterium]